MGQMYCRELSKSIYDKGINACCTSINNIKMSIYKQSKYDQ